MTNHESAERFLELMSERSLYGLDDASEETFQSLSDSHPELDPDAFDRAASAVQLASIDTMYPLPTELRAKLEANATGFVAASRSMGEQTRDWPRAVSSPPRPEPKSTSAMGWTGWLAAAAVLAFFLLQRGGNGFEPTEMRSDLMARADDLVQVRWSSTEDDLGQNASGEVVWSSARGEGYMTFRDLEGNDPSVNQYQLWIFDKDRSDAYPVDGGVFDIPAGSDEVVVPIDAKLGVDEPTLFAITLEKPGGVVVSSRERLVLVAAVE